MRYKNVHIGFVLFTFTVLIACTSSRRIEASKKNDEVKTVAPTPKTDTSQAAQAAFRQRSIQLALIDSMLAKQPSLSSADSVTESVLNTLYIPNVVEEKTNEVYRHLRFYLQNKRNYLKYIEAKGTAYLNTAGGIFNSMGLPRELNVIAAIESDFEPDLISSMGACGYWGIMDYVATEYGMNISSPAVDERRDFVKSTMIAGLILRSHYNAFGDWLLSVAAYNCGAGNVRKAIRASGMSRPSFWQIKRYLPGETQDYVLKFIGLVVGLAN
jgi:membrane-bound lytic murein transglycosylase D